MADKTKATEERKPARKRICAKNRAAIKLIRDWMSKPDDLGEEFWQEFVKELQEFRLHGEG